MVILLYHYFVTLKTIKEREIMSTNIEIEVKVLLNKDQFDQVKRIMKADKHPVKVQTNHYVDTSTYQLKKYGMALRVRETSEYVLTLKTPLAEGLLEKNQSITKTEFSSLANKKVFPEGSIKDFLISLGVSVDNLSIITSLTTERVSLDYQDCLFSMDANSYCGTTDYELEMEGSSISNAEDQLRDICEKCEVPFILNTRSKQARAMAAAKSLNEK
jgi:uncharacterized protein YjbK